MFVKGVPAVNSRVQLTRATFVEIISIHTLWWRLFFLVSSIFDIFPIFVIAVHYTMSCRIRTCFDWIPLLNNWSLGDVVIHLKLQSPNTCYELNSWALLVTLLSGKSYKTHYIKSTLVQVMVWCRQTISHYLNQCWPRFMSPYGVTRPQWAKGNACDGG